MKKLSISLMLLFMLVGCSLPGLGGSGSGSIVVASGNTTERQVNGEIVAQMIKHYMPEVDVEVLPNLGSSLLILQTIDRGDSHISSVMYTGTSLTGELGLEATTDVDFAFEQVVKGYDEEFDMVWMPSYGFDNTYAFMVTESFANEHNLEKVSDLEALSDTVRAGIDTGWLDRDGDGYEAFKALYGFEFTTLLPMEIGLVYSALQSGDMDVVLGYSSDGRIDSYNLVILEDDLQLFPPYDASPAVSQQALKDFPELETILLKLEGSISAADMQGLNRRSDEDKLEPRMVAQEFLEANNYFETVDPIPLRERPLYKDLEGLQ